MSGQQVERIVLSSHRSYHAFLTVVNSPTQFWVHLADGAPQLERLQDDIEKYQTSAAPPAPQDINIGVLCLAKYGHDGEECFYRAVITNIQEESCQVYFVDYGNSEICHVKDISAIPDCLTILPQQAVECSLAPDSTDVDFDALIESESVFATVTAHDNCGRHIVELSMDGQNFRGHTIKFTSNAPEKQSFQRLQFNLGKYVDVCVSSIEESGFFYCQLIENAPKLDHLMCELQESYDERSPAINYIEQDAVCVAFDPTEQICYRAEVISSTKDKALVRYVDFGDSVTIQIGNLKLIKTQHTTLPVQAIRCSLNDTDGIPVSTVVSILQRYSAIGLVAKVIFRTGKCCEMDLIHTSSGADVHLTDLLKGITPDETEIMKRTSAIQKVRLKPADMKLDTLEKLYVTAVNSSSEFFGQLIRYDSDDLDLMQDRLNKFYLQNTILHPDPKVEDVCCTLYSGDSHYYRAFIESIDTVNEQALVTFLDYGNHERKNFKELKLLDEQFAVLPNQGIHCTLKEFYCDIGNKFKLEELLIEKEVVVKAHGRSGRQFIVTIPACPENASVHTELAKFLKKPVIEQQVSPAPNIPETDNRNSMMEALIEGSWEEVVVSFVEDPEHFYCQQTSQLPALEVLMQQIEVFCQSLGPNEGTVDLGLGNACVAQYSEDDKWYRATITGVRTNGEVEVQFIDYGNRELVRYEQLKGVQPAFLNLPSQAYLCTLNGIVENSMWTPDQIDDFYNMADKPLMAFVISINTNNECYTMELFSGSTNFNVAFCRKHGVLKPGYQPLVIGPDGRPRKPAPPPAPAPVQQAVHRVPPPASSHPHQVAPAANAVLPPPAPVKAPASSWASWQKETPAQPTVQTLHPMQLKVNDYYDVYISYAEHPGRFWIQLVNKEDELSTLMAKLNKTYTECFSQLPLPAALARSGQPCCAKYSEDNQWYRAIIKSVSGDTTTVRFVDYGNEEEMKISTLCQMTDMYAAQPLLAAECSLMGLKPAGGEWNQTASEKFEELWYEKNLVACVTSVKPEEHFVLELMEGQHNLSEALIRAGVACGLEPQTAAPPRTLRRSSSSSTASSSRGERAPEPVLLYKRVSINVGITVEATVSHVNTPKDFFCQPIEFSPKLEEVMGQLAEYDNLRPNQLVLLRPRVGSVCAARYTADDAWYRAEVLDVDTDRVRVKFVDYGNTEWLSNDRIRNLKPELVDFPTQAVQCELADINPPSSGWTEIIAECFEDMTYEKTVNVTVRKIEGARHSILLVDASGSDLAQKLIQKGMALGDGNEVREPPRNVPPPVRSPPRPMELSEVREMRSEPHRSSEIQARGGSGEPAGVTMIHGQKVALGACFSAYITWVNSPLDFYCQKTESAANLANIQAKLQSAYGRCPPHKDNLSQPKLGQVCAAPFSEDGSWYRATISEIVGQNAVVLFVDYGNTDRLPLNKLKTLQADLGQLPIQGIHCCLDGIDDPPRGVWDKRVAQLFQKICQEELSVCIVSVRHDLCIITLKDSRGNDVTEQLVKLGVPLSPSGTPPRPEKPQSNIPKANPPHAARGLPSSASPTQVTYKPVDKPAVGKSVSSAVSFVEDLSNFWIQLSSGTAELDQLMADIEAHYTTLSPGQDSLASPSPSMACIAKYAVDGGWYRATVTKSSAGLAEVYFVDYGNSESVALNDLKTVTSNLSKLTMQALKCGLDGCNTTSDSDREKFEALVNEKELMLKVARYEGEKAVVQLEVDGKNVNNELKCQQGGRASTNEVASCYKDSSFPDSGVQVLLSHVESPDQFYVQLKAQEEEIGAYVSEVDEYYHALAAGDLPLKEAKVGGACCCQFDDDEAWYRGILEEVSGDQAIVRFIDFGNTQITTISKLKQMISKFAQKPAYAYACRLAGVRALITGWPDDAMDKFKSLTEEKVLHAEKVFAGSITAIRLQEGKRDINQIMLEYGQSDMQTSPVRTKQASATSSPPQSTVVMSGMSSERYPSVVIPSGSHQVLMSHVDSPGSFYVQLDSQVGKLQDYMDELFVEYSGYEGEKMLDQVAMGQPCCALYSEDQSWYRATVMGQPRPGQVMVRFIDYGNPENTELTNVKQLGADHMNRPPFAIRCTLGNKEWPGKDKDRLIELLEDKQIDIEFLSQKEPCQVRITVEGQDIGGTFGSSGPPSPQRVLAPPASYPKRPVPRVEVKVFVSHVNSPASFFIQLVDEVEQLEEYSTRLNENYDADSPVLPSPGAGQPCCALFSDDNMWYRAIVKQVQDNKATVLFVDYGNEETASLANIKVLTPQFGERPPYAIHCHLSGANSVWSEADIASFTESAMDKELTAKLTSDADPYEVQLRGDGISFDEFCNPAKPAASNVVAERIELVQEYGVKPVPTSEQPVIVSHIDSPGSFYLQLVSEEDELVAFSTDLTDLCYGLGDTDRSLHSVEVGQPCCALFSEDEAWYRALVESVSGGAITVRFIDYGNAETTDISKLREVDAKFGAKPPYAFHCTVIPDVAQWSDDDTKKLEQMVVDKEVKACFLSQQQPHHVALKVGGTIVNDAFTASTPQEDVCEQLTQYTQRTAVVGTNDVIVSHIDSPDSFYIQLASEEDELATFASELNDFYCTLAQDQLLLKDLKPHMPCCALFSEDEAWYRATIKTVEGNSVKVRFVDYGNTETTEISKLRKVTTQYGGKPPYALHCSLGPGSAGWTDVDTAKLEELVVDKSTVQATTITPSDPLVISLVADGVNVEEALGGKHKEGTGDQSEDTTADTCSLLPPRKSMTGTQAVIVAHVDSPSSFYVQLAEEAEALEAAATKLNEEYSELGDTDRCVTAAEVGDVFCALYSEDECWYRAIVESKCRDTITVRFVDYGNFEVTVITKLKLLSQAFADTPAYALNCCLHDLKKDCNDADTEDLMEVTLEKDAVEATFVTDQPPYCVKLVADGVDVNARFAGGEQESPMTGGPKIKITKVYEQQKGSLSGIHAVTLAHFESPNCFYLHMEDKVTELEEFADELMEMYSSLEDSDKTLDTVKVGDHCCALYSEDEVWYRAIIEGVDGGTVDVRFIDYGNMESVDISTLRSLDEKFFTRPAFAHKCHLGYDSNREWSEEKCAALEEMIADTTMMAMFSCDTEPHAVQLIVGDKNVLYQLTGEDQSVPNKLDMLVNGDISASELDETSSVEEFNSAQEDLSAEVKAVNGKDGDTDTDSDVRQVLEEQRKDGTDSALSDISDVDIVARDGTVEKEEVCEETDTRADDIPVNNLPDTCPDVAPSVESDEDDGGKRSEGEIIATQANNVGTELDGDRETAGCDKTEPINVEESDSDIDSEDENRDDGDDNGDKVNENVRDQEELEASVGVVKTNLSDEKNDVSDSESESEEEEEAEAKYDDRDEKKEDGDDYDDQAGSDRAGEGGDPCPDASDDQTPDSSDSSGEKGDGGGDAPTSDSPSSTSKECQESDETFNTAEDVTDEEAFKEDEAEGIKQEEEVEKVPDLDPDAADAVSIGVVDVPLNSKFEVTITHVVSPTNLWLSPTSSAQQQTDLEERLAEFYSQRSHTDRKDSLTVGSFCAAKSAECDTWFRAKVVEYNKDDDMLTVFFLDYGNEEQLHCDRVHPLSVSFASLPAQAVQAALESLQPVGDDWSQAAVDALYFESPLLAQVLCFDAGRAHVRLFDMGLDVAKRMVAEGLARATDGQAPTEKQQLPAQLRDPCLTEDDSIAVYVPKIVSPHDFCCQLAESSTVELPLLHDKIQAVCAEDTESQAVLDQLEPGAVCLAQYQSDENWYRARIVNINDGEIEVTFVDYGNGDTVGPSKVKAANADLLELPIQTFPCSLHGVVPVSVDWDEESSARFSELVDNKELMCHIVQIHHQQSRISSVDVELYDGEESIGNLLLSGGYAIAQHITDASLPPAQSTPTKSTSSHLPVSNEVATVIDSIFSVIYCDGESPDKFWCQIVENLNCPGASAAGRSSKVPEPYTTESGDGQGPSQPAEESREPTDSTGEDSDDKPKPTENLEELLEPSRETLCCRLAGIESDTWTPEASQYFKDFCKSGPLTVRLVGELEEEEECIYLVYLYNTNDRSGDSINHQLVSLGHAWVTLVSELCVSSEQLDDFLEEQNKTEGTFLEVTLNHTNSLGSLDGEGSPEDALEGYECSYSACQLSVGDKLDMYVRSAIDPDNIICQPVGSQSALQELMEELQKYYTDGTVRLPFSACAKGVPCLVNNNVDGRWYRARVMSKMVEEDAAKVDVYYVDYGNKETVDAASVRLLRPHFTKLPVQAIHVSVADVKPAAMTWDKETQQLLEGILIGDDTDQVVSIMVASVDEDSRVEAALVTNTGIDVGQLLIDKKLALHQDDDSIIEPPMTQEDDDEPTTASLSESEEEEVAAQPVELSVKEFLAQEACCVGCQYQARVSHVVSPSQFWCQLNVETVKELHTLLQDYYSKCEERLSEVNEGDACVVLRSSDDTWHRALVVSTYGNIASVNRVDVGGTETTTVDELRPLRQHFAILPPAAVLCSLAQCVPLHGCEWNESTCKTFSELCEGELTLEVVGIDDDVTLVHLLCKDSNESVSSQLRKHNSARECPSPDSPVIGFTPKHIFKDDEQAISTEDKNELQEKQTASLSKETEISGLNAEGSCIVEQILCEQETTLEVKPCTDSASQIEETPSVYTLPDEICPSAEYAVPDEISTEAGADGVLEETPADFATCDEVDSAPSLILENDLPAVSAQSEGESAAEYASPDEMSPNAECPGPDESSAPAEFPDPDEILAPAEFPGPDEMSTPAESQLPDEMESPAECSPPDEMAPPAECSLPDEMASPAECSLPDEMAPPAECTSPDESSPPSAYANPDEISSPPADAAPEISSVLGQEMPAESGQTDAASTVTSVVDSDLPSDYAAPDNQAPSSQYASPDEPSQPSTYAIPDEVSVEQSLKSEVEAHIDDRCGTELESTAEQTRDEDNDFDDDSSDHVLDDNIQIDRQTDSSPDCTSVEVVDPVGGTPRPSPSREVISGDD